LTRILKFKLKIKMKKKKIRNIKRNKIN